MSDKRETDFNEVNADVLSKIQIQKIRLRVLDEERSKASAVIEEEQRNLLVRCESTPRFGDGCGALTQAKDLVYVQTHRYVSPSGCMGGDYYHSADEGRFVCPACGRLNRLYYRKWLHKGMFGSVKKVFRDDPLNR